MTDVKLCVCFVKHGTSADKKKLETVEIKGEEPIEDCDDFQIMADMQSVVDRMEDRP